MRRSERVLLSPASIPVIGVIVYALITGYGFLLRWAYPLSGGDPFLAVIGAERLSLGLFATGQYGWPTPTGADVSGPIKGLFTSAPVGVGQPY